MEKSEQKVILLVEDEILIAVSEQTCLEDYGYDVIYAQNGEKAIEIVKSGAKINLILMDINLGQGIDGKKTAEEILKIINIPIVFLTSHSEREVVEKVREITRYGYVLKNSGDFVLISSIEMAFELFDAHKKTIENEERWKFALESSESGVWDWNIQTNEIFFSKQCKAMLGYEENEIEDLFDEWEKRIHPDDKEYVFKELNRHLTGETTYYQNEHRVLCKDGTYKWLLIKGKVISRTEKGNPLRAIGTNMDISYRKNIENELSEKNKELQNMNYELETAIEELETTNDELEEANNELEKSETILIEYSNKLNDILESINDAFFSVNNNLEITYFNSACERILGKKREEVLGKSFSESFPIIKGSIFEEKFLKTIRNKNPISFEEFFDKPPYSNWYDVRMYPNKDGVSVFFQITTEKKKIENALKHIEKEKLMILNSMSEIITYYKDKDLKIEWSNRTFDESVDTYSKKLKGKHCFKLWNNTNEPCPDCPVIKAFETGQSQEIEKHLLNNKYWHLRAYPIKDEDNNILGVVEIGLDITERIEKEAKFLSIFKAAPFGIGLAVNRKIQEVNDAICEMTGYKREELIQQPGTILYPTQEDYDYVGKEKYEQIAKKGIGTVETRWKRKDGNIINIILSSSPLDTNDLSKGVTFTALDITKRKQTEEELRKLLDEKNILVKEVHHRIKNNMSTIAGFLSLQTKFISDNSVKSILMDARSRIIGMMSIYDKLYRSTNFDKLSIRTYLLDLISGVETIYNIKNDTISIIKEIEDIEISSNTLFYIGIIINELIINSFKYAFPDNKSGTINLSVEKYMNNILIILRDNGIGIPDNINIEQSDSFGLTLIKLLVNNLEGKIEYVKDNGTKVIISLPLEQD